MEIRFPSENLPFRQVISSGNPVYGIRHAINSPDGRRVYLSINGAPIVDEKGDINEVVFYHRRRHGAAPLRGRNQRDYRKVASGASTIPSGQWR